MDNSRVIRLELLGPVRLLAADGRSLDAVVRQPKRLAILTYLVVHDGFVRRDTLLALGWPESSDRAARRALNQTVHFLRSMLGPDAIERRGSGEVAVSRQWVSSDIGDLHRSAQEGRLGDAIALYRGDLLQGVHVTDSVELSQWLDTARDRFRREAVEAACRHAEDLTGSGRFKAAEQAARKALDIEPTSELAVQVLVRALLQTGARADALKALREFRDRLESEYGIEPSAETVRMVEAASETGPPGEAIPEPESNPIENTAEDAPNPPAEPLAGPPKQRPSRLLRRLAGFAILLISALLLGRAAIRHGTEATPSARAHPANRVAVLYLQPRGDLGDLNYLPDALTEAVIDQLSTTDGLEVIGQSDVRWFQRDPQPAAAIAEALNVGTVVVGTLSRQGDDVRTRVQIVGADDGAVQSVMDITRSAVAPMDLVAFCVDSITAGIRGALGRSVNMTQWHAGTNDERVWELVQRAGALRRTAVSLATHGELGNVPRVYAAADSLLSVASSADRRWSVPDLLRAQLAEESAIYCMAVPECGPQTSLESVERGMSFAREAIARQPDHSESHTELGTLFFLASQLVDSTAATVYLDSAKEAFLAAIAQAPGNAMAWSRLSAVQYSRGEFATAYASAREAYRADAYLSNRAEVLGRLFLTSLHLGADDDARYWCREIEATSGGTWPVAFCQLCLLAFVDSVMPDPDSAWSLVRAHARVDLSAKVMMPRLEMLVAAVLGRVGMTDSARVLIRSGLRDARGDPDFDLFRAGALVAIGARDSAVTLLEQYVHANPAQRSAVLHWRWFEALGRSPLEDSR